MKLIKVGGTIDRAATNLGISGILKEKIKFREYRKKEIFEFQEFLRIFRYNTGIS
jgi:hypothetical protein